VLTFAVGTVARMMGIELPAAAALFAKAQRKR